MNNQTDILEPLMLLSPKHRTAFAASCCERLLPNYEAFVFQENFGDKLLLRNALDEVWQYLEEGNLSKQRAEDLIQTLEDHAPSDLDKEFHSIFLTAAQDAIGAVAYTLESCLNPTKDVLTKICDILTSTLEEYSSIVNSPIAGSGVDLDNMDWIYQSPLFKAEEEKKSRDLELLKAQQVVDEYVVNTLRQSATAVGIQPFLRNFCFDPVQTV